MSEYIFFSGKGGVGKTTMAATTALYKSEKGKRTLLVSTDPAGNLGDIFNKEVGLNPTLVSSNLSLVQMDSDTITEAYKKRMLEPLTALLDEFALEQLKEEFNGGCTVEIATFDKFTDFLSDDQYDLIVFDTAPTGHTLRLMTLPSEWDKFIQKSAEGSGQTCIGPVSQIEASQKKYAHAVKVMQDADKTKVCLVSRPEKTSVYETIRAKKELEKTGIQNFQLIINGVYPNNGISGGIFKNIAEKQIEYINELKENFVSQISEVPLQESEIKGLDNIKLLGQIAFENQNIPIQGDFKERVAFKQFSSASVLNNILDKKESSRITVLTGKGGVGKTVTACSFAMELAKKGKTLLFTSDPAAHIGQVLDCKVNHIPKEIINNLWAVNIDQKVAVEDYKNHILNEAKANGSTQELLSSLEEELESPCTEEIAIFEQFSKLLMESEWDYFVLDTAPTGHTLRLLELPFDYKKELDLKIDKDNSIGNESAESIANTQIGNLIKRLKNPNEATFLLVAYPEFTPLNEGYRAMNDLERVGIQVQGIMLNHIFNYEDCNQNPFAMERWKLQQNYLYKAKELFQNKPLFPIELQSNEIIGIDKVKELSSRIFKN
ncbi:TRC40/GET3/ArsA family transport-energizing ATPase [Ancylomarina sp. YFZ004]